jgi:hypothetical protein
MHARTYWMSLVHRVTKLETWRAHTMTIITDFIAAQLAHNEATSKAIDDVATEIGALNNTIATLKAAQGQTAPLTPEETAAMAALETSGAALQAKAQALDTLTPPAPPAPVVDTPPVAVAPDQAALPLDPAPAAASSDPAPVVDSAPPAA